MPDSVQIITYGTLMSGQRNHYLCRNCMGIVPVTFFGTLFDTRWNFPALVLEGHTQIKAELMVLPPTSLPDIDRLEGYPRLYGRKLITAKTFDGADVHGFVYFFKREQIQRSFILIPNGDWKAYHKQHYPEEYV